MTEPRLTGLFVYPLKAGAGIEAPSWEVDRFGLRYDRRWMVADLAGRLLSQRNHPRLTQVRPILGETTLTLEAAAVEPLVLPLVPSTLMPARVVVWDDVIEAGSLGPAPAQWISQVLDTPCRLVYMPDSTVRPADPPTLAAETRVSFADAFPFLLISEEIAGRSQRADAARRCR